MSDRGTWLNESPVVSKDGPESTINETRNNTIFIIYKSTVRTIIILIDNIYTRQ